MSGAEKRDRIMEVLCDEGWTCDYHEPNPRCVDCQRLWRGTAEAILDALKGADDE